jgi:hypothetical protein
MRADPPGACCSLRPVDRRLAYKNIRTGLIAGAIALVVFALAFFSGWVY